MRPGRTLFALALCLSFVAVTQPSVAEVERPRIVFLSPSSAQNTYWPQVFRIVQGVADDLGFEFVPYSLGVDDRYSRRDTMVSVLASQPRPDAAIASVAIGHTRPMMEEAEPRHIPVFVLGPLFPAELSDVGGPRQRYRSWAASFALAEEEKGYQLGIALLKAAEARSAYASDGTLHVVGVGGDAAWFGSGLRQAGLERAIREHPRARLKQVVPTQWKPEEGRELTTRLLARYPEASVVWAASDQLGLGAADALTKAGRSLGVNAFTGGLDLSDVGLQQVQEGRFVATVSSPMMAYAQMAVLVYDYLHGHDFAPELGDNVHFEPHLASAENVTSYQRLSACVGQVDFKAFSKFHNPRLSRYDFSMGAYEKAASACMHAQNAAAVRATP